MGPPPAPGPRVLVPRRRQQRQPEPHQQQLQYIIQLLEQQQPPQLDRPLLQPPPPQRVLQELPVPDQGHQQQRPVVQPLQPRLQQPAQLVRQLLPRTLLVASPAQSAQPVLPSTRLVRPVSPAQLLPGSIRVMRPVEQQQQHHRSSPVQPRLQLTELSPQAGPSFLQQSAQAGQSFLQQSAQAGLSPPQLALQAGPSSLQQSTQAWQQSPQAGPSSQQQSTQAWQQLPQAGSSSLQQSTQAWQQSPQAGPSSQQQSAPAARVLLRPAQLHIQQDNAPLQPRRFRFQPPNTLPSWSRPQQPELPSPSRSPLQPLPLQPAQQRLFSPVSRQPTRYRRPAPYIVTLPSRNVSISPSTTPASSPDFADFAVPLRFSPADSENPGPSGSRGVNNPFCFLFFYQQKQTKQQFSNIVFWKVQGFFRGKSTSKKISGSTGRSRSETS